MIQPLRDTAAHWLAHGRRAVVVAVAATRGSVPREAGTRMLVAADAVLGTIGGGHLELQAIETARELLARGGPLQPLDQTLALGPSLGQCCGGSVGLRFATLDADALAAWPAPRPRFHLQLYGAGHVGRAIAALLADIDCTVQWIDARDAEFPAAPSPAHIARVCVDAVEAEVATAPPGACYLVLTHEHALDLRITAQVLRRPDIAWCGLIGSATKRAQFLRRLAERGTPAEALARLTCPIGLPGLVGKEPAVLAISVVAQLLMHSPPVAKTTAG